MSATTSPRPLRLPGTAHVAQGPLDMTLMYVMHHAFRRDLNRFVGAVERTPLSDRSAWQALADRWDRFSAVLHHHHSIEDDTLWPPLLAAVDAVGDGQGRVTLKAMEAEHDLIDPLLESCAQGLAALATRADEDARAALEVRVVAARECLDRHLAHKETGALPLAQQHLTRAEWDALGDAARRSGGPRLLLFLVPWAVDGLGRTALERAFADAGPVFRLVWWASRATYARADRRAFRYA